MCVFSFGVLGAPIPIPQQANNQVPELDDSVREVRQGLLISLGINPTSFSMGRALKYAGATLGLGTVGGVGVPVAGTAGLTAAGFTGSGIAAGSMAAGIQSGIGSVAAGSTFATLQSIGATGGFAILGPIGLIAGAVTTVFAGAKLVSVGIRKHTEEIDLFFKTPVILLHV